jgi:hypothetical protein
MSRNVTFTACRPKAWDGRYARIPGDRSVFHIQTHGGRLYPVIFWHREDGVGTCAAIDSPGVRQLTEAVTAAKRQLGGTGGGSFQINEFGQVLVPASDNSGRRLLIGEVSEAICFQDPFTDNGLVDLSDVGTLRCGDPWPKPYVGIPHNLSGRSKIYFYRMNQDGGASDYPRTQDEELIRALRTIRRSGAARFIVNPAGVVLTKRPPESGWSAEEQWEAVFVGRINLSRWFDKEK